MTNIILAFKNASNFLKGIPMRGLVRCYSSDNTSTTGLIPKGFLQKVTKLDSLVYNLNSYTILTDSVIKKSIKFFFDKRVKHLLPNQYYYIGFVLYLENHSSPKTIGGYVALNNNCYKQYLEYILSQVALKNDTYLGDRISRIVFVSFLRTGPVPSNIYSNLIPKTNTVANLTLNIGKTGLKLPMTLILNEYPHTSFKILGDGYFTIWNKDIAYIVKSSLVNHLVKNVVEVVKNGMPLIKYTDTQISKIRFKREIRDVTYYYKLVDGVWVLDFVIRNSRTSYLRKVAPHKKLDNNFGTIDIETYREMYDGNAKLIPYLVSIFDGVNPISFYLTDFYNSKDMLTTALGYLLQTKYNGYIFYAHNLSGFDLTFLYPVLSSMGNIRIIENKGKVLLVKVTGIATDNPRKKVSFTICDSYLLLNSNLNDLANSFGVENRKSIFPLFFANLTNLNYIGQVPYISHFKEGLTQSEYVNYVNGLIGGVFNLREEAVKYCENDCIVLYQIMLKYQRFIWEEFGLNITRTPTITSLAFGIFRSKFLNKLNVPVLNDNITKELRAAYTGGAVDMYIPSNLANNGPVLDERDLTPTELVYNYDFNSLFPFVMKNCDVPIGNPIHFEGEEALKVLKNKLGFYLCEVTAPKDLKHPIIQIHHKLNSAQSTLSPTGAFLAYLYSEEVENARKYGYEFKILSGIFFEGRANIFKEYVEYFYNQIMQHPKGSALNLVSKLLLNSLYGRFGIKTSFPDISLLTGDQYNYFMDHYNQEVDPKIDGATPLDNGDVILKLNKEKIEDTIDSFSAKANGNVAIAASITANARILMSQFKNRDDIRLYYTDSDSLFINKSPEELNILFPGLIGSDIGQLKLEYVADIAIFPAPIL